MNEPTPDQTSSVPHSKLIPEEGNDPKEPTPLYLEITRIQCYDRNPRQCENPEYDRIKASIRSRNMDQSLVITRRPGETDYMVCAGGNTCLQILKELYAETADERFLFVHCLFRPWRCEADVLLAHLKENDLRGDLAFIDKARAVQAIKRLILEETGDADMTQGQLAEVLKNRGYNLSQGLISQMEYTVDRLLPALPQALQSGMGRPQVERIRSLDKTVRRVWSDRGVGTIDEYETAFTVLCRRFDGPEWDFDNLRQALEAEIAMGADIDLHTIRMELDARLMGREPVLPDESWDADWKEAATTDGAYGSDDPDTFTKSEEELSVGSEGADTVDERTCDETATDEPSGSEINSCLVSAESDEPENSDVTTPKRLDALRLQAWTLAFRIAQRNGLGELVQPLSDNGFGFILSDVPDPALVKQLDEDRLAQVSMVWWHLAACSELTVAPVEYIVPRLEVNSVLRRALEDQDATVLFNSVWTLDPGHQGFRLWRQLDDGDWSDLIDLMENYRSLTRVAAATGESIWS